jgi:hypothetical protein
VVFFQEESVWKGDVRVKWLISKRAMMHIGLLAVLIISGQANASSQWPFPQGTYPRDAVYYQYLLDGTSQDQRSKPDERRLDVVRDKSRGVPNTQDNDKSMWSLGDTDEYEHYDYWVSK